MNRTDGKRDPGVFAHRGLSYGVSELQMGSVPCSERVTCGSYDLGILRSAGGSCAVLGWGQPDIFFEDFGKIVLVSEAAAFRDLADRKRRKTQIFTGMNDTQIVHIVVECDTHLFFEKLAQIRAVQMDVGGHLFQRDLLGIVVVNVSALPSWLSPTTSTCALVLSFPAACWPPVLL